MRDYHHPCNKYQTYMLDLKKQISESKKLKAELQVQGNRGSVEIPKVSGCEFDLPLLMSSEKTAYFGHGRNTVAHGVSGPGADSHKKLRLRAGHPDCELVESAGCGGKLIIESF